MEFSMKMIWFIPSLISDEEINRTLDYCANI